MYAKPLAAVAAFFVAALCALAPSAASAQNRDNVYAVSGVRVDETAANAQAAQTAGFAAAQRQAFQRLVQRLTLPEELARAPVPTPDAGTLDSLVLSVDVEEERRSGTRYLGRLAVRFDATRVRALLRAANLTVADTRAPPVLVAAVTVSGATAETAALWREVWAQGGYADELVPLLLAPDTLQGEPSWQTAAPLAQAQGAGVALFATLRVQGSTLTATLVEVDTSGQRSRGDVTARSNGSDAAALRTAMTSLAEQASLRLQNEWKSRISSGANQRGRINASALYSNQTQWESIKQALEGAAQSVISEIRIEAVGRDGALVSFTYVGNESQLSAELQRRGIRMEPSPNGVVLRVAAGR